MAMDKLHRFHVDFEDGGEAEYLVNGVDVTTAALRLSGILGTNDKVHERPQPDASLGLGVFVVEDLPCAMDQPDSVGVWLWWRKGDDYPVIVNAFMSGEITRVLMIQQVRPYNGVPYPAEQWKTRNPVGLYTKVFKPL